MLKKLSGIQFKLQIHVTSLVFTLVVISCSTIGWYAYQQLSKVIVENELRTFSEVTNNVESDHRDSLEQLESLINVYTFTGLTRASNLEQRLPYLPLLRQTIGDKEKINAIYVGYDNGDMFLFRALKSDTLINRYQAPKDSRYMLTSVDDGQAQQRFFNEELLQIKGMDDPNYRLDPRTRPWFQEAMSHSKAINTEPYVFYTTGQLGMTMARRNPEQTAVVGIDYTLEYLSKRLNQYQITPSAELVIHNSEGKVLAWSNNDISQVSKDRKLPDLLDLNSEVIQQVAGQLRHSTGMLDFDFQEREWRAQTSLLPFKAGQVFYLSLLAPNREVLANAYRLRAEAAVLTLLIIMLALPVSYIFSQFLTNPLARLGRAISNIRDFNFSSQLKTGSVVSEINDLSDVIGSMQGTISHFQQLSVGMLSKQSFNQLLDRICQDALSQSPCEGALVLLQADSGQLEIAHASYFEQSMQSSELLGQSLPTNLINGLFHQASALQPKPIDETAIDGKLANWLQQCPAGHGHFWSYLTLKNQSTNTIGYLLLVSHQQASFNLSQIGYLKAMAGFSALAIESQQAAAERKLLLDSFLELIADAIDGKSPYTGGHCARVPVLTRMLTQAACDSQSPIYRDFNLSAEQWEELHIAAWLHDCGKIITPEDITDKATKLEVTYNRIHEIRMRFELLKLEAERSYWQALSEGGNREQLQQQKDHQLAQLDSDFAFVAECNIGGESMTDERLTRLKEIAAYQWQRTLDDRLGLSAAELKQRQQEAAQPLPCSEQLLSDKQHHLVARRFEELTKPDNPWGFKMTPTEHRANHGELYNLSIGRGTLTEEDRFIIQSHMVHTTVMLSKLPFPKHLADVQRIACGHHERMDGKGYPLAIPAGELPLTARVIAIADIFEALTAADRPYKPAKKLSEALQIMTNMVLEQHIDAQLFELFLSAGIYRQYADQFLKAEQDDAPPIERYLEQVRRHMTGAIAS